MFRETGYLITQEGLQLGSIFHKKKRSFKNQSWTMAKAQPVILWGSCTFQRECIVNLETKAIEVQKNHGCPTGHNLWEEEEEKSALRKSIQVFP